MGKFLILVPLLCATGRSLDSSVSVKLIPGLFVTKMRMSLRITIARSSGMKDMLTVAEDTLLPMVGLGTTLMEVNFSINHKMTQILVLSLFRNPYEVI